MQIPTIMNIKELIVIFIFAASLAGCREAKHSNVEIRVPVATATPQDVPVTMQFVGQTYGRADINIVARVNGYLKGIYFSQGSSVRVGQLLYRIEPQPIEAQVAEANAALASAVSALVQAQSNYNRVKPLAAIYAVSQSTLDDASAQLSAAQAQVNSAEAQLEYARIQLSYTDIRSPINGVIGLTNARVGDYVGLGSNIPVLNTVSQIDTILVRFYIPSDRYTTFAEKGSKIRFNDIRLKLSNGQYYPLQGRFDFIGRAVSPSTGSIDVQVSFANPDSLLRPGEFAEITAVVDTLHNRIVIPQRAVIQTQNNNSVMTLDSEDRVQIQSITLGPKWGEMWVVESGLKSGERVVVEGLHKLKSGMKVTPEPFSTKNQQNEE